MAKLSKTIKVEFTPDANQDPALFTLRKPSDAELNRFTIDRYSIRESEREKVFTCRAAFFDSLLTNIEKLEDDSGAPLTLTGKAEIPEQWKSAVIYRLYEVYSIDIKN